MKTKLQKYFPDLIRSREAVEHEIAQRTGLTLIYNSWTKERQQEFLDFCTGVKGINVMYDFVSKSVLNPDAAPERLNDLLSVLLKQKVRIKSVLPLEGGHIADDQTLVIMDLLVELEDGRLADFEIQKIGYKFPGERAACYVADLLLRQYKRIRSQSKKNILNYHDIKDVYAIVLFERSSKEFHEFPNVYLHRFKQKSDSGLELNLLQNFIFIPLDIYQEIQHNKGGNNNKLIETRLDAWLNFFSSDDPEIIIEICEKYPDFKEMYQEIYVICRNLEGVMTMFSEELRQLDKNTVRLMIDDLQNELDQAQGMLDLTQEELDQKNEELNQKKEELDQKREELDQKKEELDQKKEELDQKNEELNQRNEELDQVKREAAQSAKRGELTTLIRQCVKKMQKGTSVEDIADTLEEDFSVIQSICNIAEKYAPEYEVEKICNEVENML